MDNGVSESVMVAAAAAFNGGVRRSRWRTRDEYFTEAKFFWGSRRNYSRTSDWVWSLYNRLLNGRLGKSLGLPLRHHVRPVHLRGIREPFYLRLGTTDWLVLEELQIFRGYDCVFREPIGPVRAIVDLGANIGMSVRLWKAHFPDARVVAVEPAADNFRVCQMNANALPSGASVELINACAAGKARTVFLDGRRGEWSTTMLDQPVADEGESIQALTTESICDRLGAGGVIDLLKCDVEGAEREIFADCAHWIHRVRNILIELHDPYSKDDFLADLERNGARFRATVLEKGAGVMELFLTSER